MRRLQYNVTTQLHNNTISFEFSATDSEYGEVVDLQNSYYSVRVDADAKEACLCLIHLASDVVASDELSAQEKIYAVNAINLEYVRLTHILTTNLYKITYVDTEKYPINESIVTSSDLNCALYSAHQGKFLSTDFHNIVCEQVADENIISIEKVSFFEACVIMRDNE